MAKRYTEAEILRYLESSDEEPFSSGSDDEWQPNNEDEEIETTEVIANFIASNAERFKFLVPNKMKNKKKCEIFFFYWKA